MNTVSDVELSAYLDNEISAPERARIDALLQQSPALQTRLEQLQAADEAARAWFAAVDEQPLPAGLEQSIRNAPLTTESVTQTGAAVLPFYRRLPRPLWGMAASLLLAAALVWQLQSPTSNPAPTNLTAALGAFADSARTGDILDGGAWRAELVMSWQNADGRRCREIAEHRAEGSVTHIACGAPGQWQWQQQTLSQEYQTASHDEQRTPMSGADENAWLGLD